MVEATARSRAEWGREPPAPKIRSKGPAGMDWDETPEGCLQLGFRLGSVVKTPLGCVVAGGATPASHPSQGGRAGDPGPASAPGGREGPGNASVWPGCLMGPPSRALLPSQIPPHAPWVEVAPVSTPHPFSSSRCCSGCRTTPGWRGGRGRRGRAYPDPGPPRWRTGCPPARRDARARSRGEDYV